MSPLVRHSRRHTDAHSLTQTNRLRLAQCCALLCLLLGWSIAAPKAAAQWAETTIDGNFALTRSVYAADIDGDGDLDVLGAALSADDIAWWRNGDSNGGGDGSSWTETTIDGNFGAAHSVYAVDLDGDGDLDVLGAAIFDDDIAWWRNGDSNGGGDGSSWTETTIDMRCMPS